MGKLQHFTIEFDDPHAVFFAGCVVSGRVDVVLSKPMEVESIQMNFFGRAKVRFYDSRKEKTYRTENIYVDDTIYFVQSDSNPVKLDAGSHQYPFRLVLPATLPSSIEGEHGYVRYVITSSIVRPWKFDHMTRAAFTVVSAVDLNIQPYEYRVPVSLSNSDTIDTCCRNSGTVSVTVRLSKRCFVPGEAIFINAEIENESSMTIHRAWANLKQHTEFFAKSEQIYSSDNFKSKSVSAVEETVMKEERIAGGTTGVWSNVPLVIPSVPPSTLPSTFYPDGSNLIIVNYELKFYVAAVNTILKLSVNLLIGTVPLRESVYGQHSVITTQPSAPSTEQPSAEQPEGASCSSLLPPSYEESVRGRVSIKEDNDSEYLRGNLTWAPAYPMYRQLSVQSTTTEPPPEYEACTTDVNLLPR